MQKNLKKAAARLQKINKIARGAATLEKNEYFAVNTQEKDEEFRDFEDDESEGAKMTRE